MVKVIKLSKFDYWRSKRLFMKIYFMHLKHSSNAFELARHDFEHIRDMWRRDCSREQS